MMTTKTKKTNDSKSIAVAKVKKTNDKSVNYTKIIQPKFWWLFRPEADRKYDEIILKGGRSSFKSSTAAIKLVTLMIQYASQGKQVNIVIIRKTIESLEDSVYKKILWAAELLGVRIRFKTTKRPLKIIDIATGSTFYFYGLNKYERLKSNDVGNVVAVWYEEAAEFSNAEEFVQNNNTFTRQKPDWLEHALVLYTYNPPRNPYNWINKWCAEKEKEPTYRVDTSTYLNDRLRINPKSMLRSIKITQKNDKEFYDYMYLGKPVGNGINIYNFPLFHQIDDLRDTDQIMGLYYGMDVGHEVSATTCVCVGLTTTYDVIVLDTYYYSPAGRSRKKAPSELAKETAEFIKKTHETYGSMIRNITIDSAEGGLRNELKNYHGIRAHPVNKPDKLDLIDGVQSLLAQGRVFVIKRASNEIFLSQNRNYHYDEKTMETDNVKVYKHDDHTCDAFQYVCWDNRKAFRKDTRRRF